MKRRTNSADGKQFWGCRNFPECRHTEEIEGGGRGVRKVAAPEMVATKKEMLDKAVEFAKFCGDFHKATDMLELASRLFGEDEQFADDLQP
jgi:ssDNA-binding Zn-finger/Zn-ribbon topoisomerase 1